ncbi:hypothetical protein [Crocinitomix catalasitica]|uniref:hypothetical protein n=1 Tax=Crocinitomix catalasitica TaxID=184607 RepID=UPI000487F2F5|nr:hypothetical protein [Crocinitomix catalasitica]
MIKKIKFNRYLRIIILLVLLFLIPAVSGIVFSEKLLDFKDAAKYGFIFGIFLSHSLFSFFFIKNRQVNAKIIYAILTSFLSVFFFIITGKNDWIIYIETQYLGLILTNVFLGLLIWTIIWLINKVFTKSAAEDIHL